MRLWLTRSFSTSVTRARGLWHEPWFRPDEEYEDWFLRTLESFAEFNGAEKTVYALEN